MVARISVDAKAEGFAAAATSSAGSVLSRALEVPARFGAGGYSPRFASAAMRWTWARARPNCLAIAAGPTPAASAARTIFSCPGVSAGPARLAALARRGAPAASRSRPRRFGTRGLPAAPLRLGAGRAQQRLQLAVVEMAQRARQVARQGEARPVSGSLRGPPAPRGRPVPVISSCAPAIV